MAAVADHYKNMFPEVYSWMLGGFENAVSKNIVFFERYNIKPEKNRMAI